MHIVSPIVTLDFDCVVAVENFNELRKKLKELGFKVKKHPHTIEVTSPDSDIKIHIQTDERYLEFIKSASKKQVMGYTLWVAKKRRFASWQNLGIS